MDRREFLKLAGAQTGLLAMGADSLEATIHASTRREPGGGASPDVVVVGAGAFGGWTALYLRGMGHRVTLVDAWGPGNSRSTSGDETRGIRTGYAERELWTRWASEAIVRWKRWDEEWGRPLRRPIFTPTGDLIMRTDWDPFMTETRKTWDQVGVRYDVLTGDEVRRRYPQIKADDIGVALLEHDAGVARARFACQTVAAAFQARGGELVLARAELGRSSGDRLLDVNLAPGTPLAARTFVFALGPWFPKAFPDVMADRLRTPRGNVYYFGTPMGDTRFTHPHLPSFNFPGVTGWPCLGHDSRGFRVRTGGAPPQDPDTYERWIDPAQFEQPRKFLAERFPDLQHAPLLETRSCLYESSVDRNFIVDRHPHFSNVWIAGGGSAEGFKFGPVIGQYIAERVTGRNDDAELAAQFKLKDETFATS